MFHLERDHLLNTELALATAAPADVSTALLSGSSRDVRRTVVSAGYLGFLI